MKSINFSFSFNLDKKNIEVKKVEVLFNNLLAVKPQRRSQIQKN